MNLVIDGNVYDRQLRGGINNIFDEVLPRMCDLDPNLRVTLFAMARSLPRLPRHGQISHAPFGRLERYLPRRIRLVGSRVLRRIERQAIILPRMDGIWHSTLYSLPRLWRGPIVVSIYDMIFQLFYRNSGPLQDQIIARIKRSVEVADAVLAISETTKQDLISYYKAPAQKIHVVPLACGSVYRPLPADQWHFKLPDDRPFLLYVGARHKHKNFERLIEAYRAWALRKEVRLVVATSVQFKKVEKQPMADLEDDVYLIVNADDATLCELYNRAQAFIYPSLYEGFGIPLLEAMACGCPIAASHIPSTIEVAQDYPVYFDPKDCDSIKAALDEVLRVGRSRAQMGLERAQQFSWDRTAAETLAVYRSLAN